MNKKCKKCDGTGKVLDRFIQIAGGSMGYGLPGAVGLALSKKMKGEDGKVYCLMSDGELAIGTTWESALIASQHKLDNLVVLIDYNGLQAMGATKSILKTPDNFDIWYSLGFDVDDIDGHNFEQIENRIEVVRDGRPCVIFAKTTKGKGVSFMENVNLYHYKQLSGLEYNEAKKCLS